MSTLHRANAVTGMDLEWLTQRAVQALLSRSSVRIMLPPGWVRHENWPLPIKREAADLAGYVRQDYRPMAVLEFVEAVLLGVEKSARMVASASQAREQDGGAA